VLAIGLLAAWPKQALSRLLRQPSEADGPSVEGCILSQTHFFSNLAQVTGILGPDSQSGVRDRLGFASEGLLLAGFLKRL
jgi:hypothetical protein